MSYFKDKGAYLNLLLNYEEKYTLHQYIHIYFIWQEIGIQVKKINIC